MVKVLAFYFYGWQKYFYRVLMLFYAPGPLPIIIRMQHKLVFYCTMWGSKIFKIKFRFMKNNKPHLQLQFFFIRNESKASFVKYLILLKSFKTWSNKWVMSERLTFFCTLILSKYKTRLYSRSFFCTTCTVYI